MNKTQSILRLAVLLTLGTVAAFGIFSTPLDDSTTWFADLVIGKVIGIAAAFATHRLYRRWSKIDPWLKAYEAKCRKTDSNPNPMYTGEEAEGL